MWASVVSLYRISVRKRKNYICINTYFSRSSIYSNIFLAFAVSPHGTHNVCYFLNAQKSWLIFFFHISPHQTITCVSICRKKFELNFIYAMRVPMCKRIIHRHLFFLNEMTQVQNKICAMRGRSVFVAKCVANTCCIEKILWILIKNTPKLKQLKIIRVYWIRWKYK